MTHRTSHTTRRRLLATAAAVTLAPSSAIFAQAYPAKPVRWIVPYPAGGGSGLPGANRRCADGKAVGSAAGDRESAGRRHDDRRRSGGTLDR